MKLFYYQQTPFTEIHVLMVDHRKREFHVTSDIMIETLGDYKQVQLKSLSAFIEQCESYYNNGYMEV